MVGWLVYFLIMINLCEYAQREGERGGHIACIDKKRESKKERG